MNLTNSWIVYREQFGEIRNSQFICTNGAQISDSCKSRTLYSLHVDGDSRVICKLGIWPIWFASVHRPVGSYKLFSNSRKLRFAWKNDKSRIVIIFLLHTMGKFNQMLNLWFKINICKKAVTYYEFLLMLVDYFPQFLFNPLMFVILIRC